MASVKNITMREYNGTDYDTLYPKTIASQVDGVYNKTEVDTLLANKEPSFSVLPITKGGTGVQNATALRFVVGIGKWVNCGAGKSVNITLPDSGSYLICANDNIRYGAILVQTGSNAGSIKKITDLSAPGNWSYANNNGVLTLSETDGQWEVNFYITSFGTYAYE